MNAYLAGGLDGLRPQKAPAKAGRIPATLADEITDWVIGGPAQQGLDRANWTHEEIAGHLRRAKGIRTRRSAVPRFWSRIDIRPCWYVRGKPEK